MRLTYKLKEPIITKYLHYDYMLIADYDIKRGNYGKISQDEIYNKLGQLEDIEDEYAIQDTTDLRRRLDLADKYGELSEQLGIDLTTLFKLIDKGAFIKEYKEPIKHTNNLQLNNYGRAGWCLGNRSHNLWLKQYGEYFALTKEELEK